MGKISEYNIPTAFEMMMGEKLIDEPVFSFYLQKDASAQGQLTFGGVDHSKFDGEIEYVPLTDESYWKVSLEGMKYGSNDITSGVSAIEDCGSGWRDARRGQGVHDRLLEDRLAPGGRVDF